MKKIGILGGISYVSTLEYYRTLHELYYERQGDYYYPEMAAVRLGLKKLFLTGIRYTMQESFYPEGLSGFGIEVLVPSREEQEEIDAIIFGELTRGLVTPASRARFLEIISVYPTDGVILGCTELPRLVNEEDTDRILLDSLRIHCREVMKYVCGT